MVYSSKYEIRPKCIFLKFKDENLICRQEKATRSIMQLFELLSTSANECPQPWLPLIDDLIDDAFL